MMQSKLHLLQHDKGFLQSNLKYLTELGNKLSQFAEDARAEATSKAEAHTAEVERRKRIISLRASLADSRSQNEIKTSKSTGLGHQISDLKVTLLSCLSLALILPSAKGAGKQTRHFSVVV